jgi:hypothetical protein
MVYTKDFLKDFFKLPSRLAKHAHATEIVLLLFQNIVDRGFESRRTHCHVHELICIVVEGKKTKF